MQKKIFTQTTIMKHYVTLFDSLFLPQGMALHISMERHLSNYKLWVLCVDDKAHQILTDLQLPNVELLKLSDLEGPELLNVKPLRSKAEYCWTLTPFAPRFVFEADVTVDQVTYLDADLWFRKSPDLLFKEFENSRKEVLITDHAYSPEHDQSENSGQYCVQVITFNRHGGEVVRKWWEDRCLEWCFARVEDGKFGDQKYLDEWPIRFDKEVHVLENKELVLGPWNAQRFPYGNAIIWHFQGVRILPEKNNIRVFFGGYSLPETTTDYVYRPYIDDLMRAIAKLSSRGVVINAQFKAPSLITQIRFMLSPLRAQLRKIHRTGYVKYKIS